MIRFLKDWKALLALVVLLTVVSLAVLAPAIVKHPPNQMRTERMLSPRAEWWFGTDIWGRDVFSRICYGGRTSLLAGVLTASAALLIGGILGMSCGMRAGRLWDTIVMRLMDVLLSFPTMVLAVLAVAFVGNSLPVLIAVIAAMEVPQFARIAYNSTRAVKELDFVLADRAIGASTVRIAMRDIVPAIFAPLVVQFSLSAGHAILVEAGLSFVGLGPAPPTVSWGQMIRQAIDYLSLGWLPILWPSLFISLTILALNVLGDVLRDNLDPTLRTRA